MAVAGMRNPFSPCRVGGMLDGSADRGTAPARGCGPSSDGRCSLRGRGRVVDWIAADRLLMGAPC